MNEAEKLKNKELSERVILAAIEVHKNLGSGFPEKFYQKAFEIELMYRSINFEREKSVDVFFKDNMIGHRQLDFYIEDELVVELKAVSELEDQHLCQAINYLECIKKKSGLLINFGSAKIQIRRIYNNKISW